MRTMNAAESGAFGMRQLYPDPASFSTFWQAQNADGHLSRRGWSRGATALTSGSLALLGECRRPYDEPNPSEALRRGRCRNRLTLRARVEVRGPFQAGQPCTKVQLPRNSHPLYSGFSDG